MSPRSSSESVATVPQRSPRARHRRGQGRAALLFLLPLLAFYGLYFGYSFDFLATVARQRVSLSFVDAVDVGWENYRLTLTDPLFIRALVNNFVFAGVSIAASLTVGFLVAMLLAVGVRLKKTLYVIFLLPSLLPLALFATVFGTMLGTQYGAFNVALESIGLGFLRQDWLGNDSTAYAAVFVLLVYLVGLPIMYYHADVEAIDLSVIESAVMDGAGPWRIFRSMLFPLLKGTHRTVILAVLLASFRAFDVVWFSTNGGPSGATAITGTYLYGKTVASGQVVGYAAATSVITLLIALVISVVQIAVQRRSDR
mgnify:CR=1 FL=1